jgi:hypothetical protein
MAGFFALFSGQTLVAAAGPAVAMHQAFIEAVLVMAMLLALAVHFRRLCARCGGDGVFEFGAGACGALGGKTIGSEILALGRVRHGDDLLTLKLTWRCKQFTLKIAEVIAKNGGNAGNL